VLKIAVSAETDTWTTRNPDPEDSWDQGDSEGRVSNVRAFVDRGNSYHYGDSIAKDLDVKYGDTVYAVVADYSSGSTFGRSGGHAQVLDVFTTPEEAAALAEAAGAGTDYSFEHNGKDYSRSWVGYFEDLNDLAVWDVIVRQNPEDPIRKGSGRYSQKRGH
jgi:hypothetical protein